MSSEITPFSTGSYHLFHFPDEILLKILSELNVKDALHFFLGSKLCHRFSDERQLWNAFLRRDFKHVGQIDAETPQIAYKFLHGSRRTASMVCQNKCLWQRSLVYLK